MVHSEENTAKDRENFIVICKEWACHGLNKAAVQFLSENDMLPDFLEYAYRDERWYTNDRIDTAEEEEILRANILEYLKNDAIKEKLIRLPFRVVFEALNERTKQSGDQIEDRNNVLRFIRSYISTHGEDSIGLMMCVDPAALLGHICDLEQTNEAQSAEIARLTSRIDRMHQLAREALH